MKHIIITFPLISFAASNGHHASGNPSDLIPSFVNVFLLLGFLIWKLKPMVKDYFLTRSNEVESVMKRAENKAKEAGEMMVKVSKKMADSDSEIETLKNNAISQFNYFKTENEAELGQKLKRLVEDAQSKIEAEKKSLSDSVNNLLVDKVINKSKDKISSNAQLAKESRDRLLGGL